MVLFCPEKRIGDQEVLYFRSAVIVNQRAPVWMGKSYFSFLSSVTPTWFSTKSTVPVSNEVRRPSQVISENSVLTPIFSPMALATSTSYPHSQVLAVASNYTHIFFALGFLNRAAMPRVAAKLGVSPLTEISDVIDASTFKRAIYAGGVITTVKTSGTYTS